MNRRDVLHYTFRLVVFIGCAAGFSLQIRFMHRLYTSYPYDMLLEDRRTNEQVFPSVTICTDFWISPNSEGCRKEPSLCSWEGQHVTVGVFRMQFDPWMAASMSHEPHEIFTCRMKSLLPECESFDCTAHIRRTMFWPSSKFCFTLDNYMYSSQAHVFHQCKQQWMYELELSNSWRNDTITIMNTRLMPIFVQRPYTAIPERLAQIYLEPGKVFSLNTRQMIAQRLPPPYMSNCTDYDAAGLNPRFFGYALRDACLQDCQMKIELAHCGCVVCDLHQLAYPGEKGSQKPCNMIQSMLCFDRVQALFSNCSLNCPPACRDIYYDLRTSGVRNLLTREGNTNESTVLVKLRFRSNRVDYSVEQPSIDVLELMGYVGGFLGSWLGMSLLHSLFDMDRCFCKICVALKKFLGRLRIRNRDNKQRLFDFRSSKITDRIGK